MKDGGEDDCRGGGVKLVDIRKKKKLLDMREKKTRKNPLMQKVTGIRYTFCHSSQIKLLL